MTFESNAPVIVGAAVTQQRFDDPRDAAEAGLLMRTALERAADDAGSRRFLEIADLLLTPQGTWRYTNPSTIVAPWNPALRSVVADTGVLQQTLIARACAMVADGSAGVVMVCGGEAKFRTLRTQITGLDAPDSVTIGAPDERLVRPTEILTQSEIERGLVVPARQYAMIDTALRRAQSLSIPDHIDTLASRWSDFNRIAQTNPDAWTRTPVDRARFVDADVSNPMLSWPYTKLHCSQWNVDQAAALIICSAATARTLGIARERWVFAHVGVESNLTVPLPRRVEMHRSPAVAVVADALRRQCGLAPADFDHVDIYSCFPAAVRVQVAELGLTDERPLTVTGGMTFAGGPFNNYTLQATVKMVQVLRSDSGARGLVTNVSGMLTKFGVSVWSCSPPARIFAAIDVSDEAAVVTGVADVDPDYSGVARALTYTVAFDKGDPVRGFVIAEAPDGRRCIASCDDADVMSDMLTNDWCDRAVEVNGPTLVG